MPTTTIAPPVLRADNPYYYGQVFIFPDGSVSLDGLEVVYIPSENDRYYTVGEGESLSDISDQAYSNSKSWWVIAKVNNIFFPLDLEVGATLVIPDLDTFEINNL